MIRDCVDKWYKCALKRVLEIIARKLETYEDASAEGSGTRAANRVVKEPPRFTIKLHIYVGFIFSFFIAITIGVALVSTMFMMERNFRFVEFTKRYMYQIYRARHFEQEYFLSGRNLKDAVDYALAAKTSLLDNYERLNRVIDAESMVPDLERYVRLLEDLETLERQKPVDYAQKKSDIREELQKCGEAVVAFVRDLTRSEKDSMDKMIIVFRLVHIYAILFLLFFIFFIIHLLGSRVLRPINRFSEYTRHIAKGKYTAIMPLRRYRDEFTDLSLSINQMIKEMDRQQEVLAQSHKLRAVGTLTAGIAHELNNPVNNITLTAHMLLEEYHDLSDEERQDMINDVMKEADRARNIVRNLLDFARESESIMEPIGLGDVISETLKLSGNQIKLAGVTVELTVAPNLPRIHGDRHQLEQVFLNLLINALYVTPKGGKISIDVAHAEESSFIAVKVTDYGTGIPDHVLHHILDPFFTTKAKGKGTGLGLSVSQGIIAKHGGNISVKTSQGKGASFIVKLPITTIPAELRSTVDESRKLLIP